MDIFCQQFGNICKLNLYNGIGYILPTIGGYMSIGGQNILFLKIIHILVNAQSAALRPKGAQHTPIIDIYLSSVGRIYPIPEYICPLLAKYIQYQNISANCWQNISNTTVRGPTVRGPNCPGPNCPPLKNGQLGRGQLGPGQFGLCLFVFVLDIFCQQLMNIC